MLKSYLTVALRTLRRQPGYAALHVVGLAVGVACCLLIGLYVLDEVRFDRFHTNAERTFRVVEVRATPDLGDQRVAATVGPVRTTLTETIPEATAATRLINLWRMTVERGEHRTYVGDYLIAEPSFFDVFDGFTLLQGDPSTALAGPHRVVLTETAARQYFGDEDPMGQTLEVEGPGTMTVSGVLADPPANSHLTFSMLFSAATLAADVDWWESYTADWTPNFRSFLTYATLADAGAAPTVEARLNALLDEHQAEGESTARAVELQPLSAVHFGSSVIEDAFNQGKRPITVLYAFSAIALFVLLIACINYMNLATARSLRRAREVGVRKAIGAYRGQLAGQFMSEAVLLAAAAVAGAIGIAALALPAFNEIAGKSLTLAPDGSAWLLVSLAGLVLLVGVVAGSYPALVLSGFRPAQALRGSHTESRGRLRHGLVITQFALSIGLVVAMLTVVRQMDYVQSKPLGFESDGLVVVDINSGDVRRQFRAMKAGMEAIPAVRRVAVTSRVPGDWKDIVEIEALPDGATEATPRTLAFIGADEDFLATFDVTLAAGRNFSPRRPADSSAVLLNETAVRALGLTDPVGQRIAIPQAGLEGGGTTEAALSLEVIGVVEDFHFRSLHEPIRPLAIGAWNNPIHAIDYFTARVRPEDLPATIGALRAIGERFDPDRPFEYNFLDQRLADFYESEARTAQLFAIAAGLALALACLGLLGLAAYVAERRTKEIGVRKVLGASVASIVVLLSKDFARLVLIAAAVAAPVAWFAMQEWLDGFAYRIDLGPGVFLLAAGLALVVALSAVSLRAVRAALADPVRSLHHE